MSPAERHLGTAEERRFAIPDKTPSSRWRAKRRRESDVIRPGLKALQPGPKQRPNKHNKAWEGLGTTEGLNQTDFPRSVSP